MYLGPSSDDTKITGLIKSKLTIIFNEINSALDDMIAAWQTLDTTTQATVKVQISSFSSSIVDLKTQI